MAIVCDELKFIYFLAPGTGSSALLHFFLDNFKVAKVPNLDSNKLNNKGKVLLRGKHSTYEELVNNNLLDERQYNYLKITGARNPFDYFYAEWYRSKFKFSKDLGNQSSWIYQTPKGKQRIAEIVDALTLEFSDWLTKRLQGKYNKQKQMMLFPNFTNHASSFIRTECMNEDLNRMLSEHCGINKIYHVPKKNFTKRDRCYWKHYSFEAREMVEYIYKPYIDKFGYVF